MRAIKKIFFLDYHLSKSRITCIWIKKYNLFKCIYPKYENFHRKDESNCANTIFGKVISCVFEFTRKIVFAQRRILRNKKCIIIKTYIITHTIISYVYNVTYSNHMTKCVHDLKHSIIFQTTFYVNMARILLFKPFSWKYALLVFFLMCLVFSISLSGNHHY